MLLYYFVLSNILFLFYIARYSTICTPPRVADALFSTTTIHHNIRLSKSCDTDLDLEGSNIKTTVKKLLGKIQDKLLTHCRGKINNSIDISNSKIDTEH